MRTGLAILAVPSAIAMTVIAAPALARAEFQPDAKSCAALYGPVSLAAAMNQYYDPTGEAALYKEATVSTGPLALWRYSNARFIDFNARYKALSAKFSGRAQEPAQGTFGALEDARFPGGRLILPEKPGEKLTEMPPERTRTPEFGWRLTRCDKAHGFAPVFWYGAPDTLSCAVALYMGGYQGPEFQARALAETRAAIEKHMRTFGGNEAQINQQVMEAAEARVKRINEGKEPINQLGLEIDACRIDLLPFDTRHGKGISSGGPFHFVGMFKDNQGRGYGVAVIGGRLPGPTDQARSVWLWDMSSFKSKMSQGEYDTYAMLWNVYCGEGTVQYRESVIFNGETLVAREKRYGPVVQPRPGSSQQAMFDVVCDPSKRSSKPPYETFAQVHRVLENRVAKGD